MDAKVAWQQGLSLIGSADSGFTVPLGADLALGGANDGFRPLELMAISLAGCTAMDVISILTKKQQAVTAFDVAVHADRAEEHPKVFTRAVIEYQVAGHTIDEAAVRRAIDLSAAKYCPAQNMLGKVMPIELHYKIFEDEGKGRKRLEKEGTVQPAV